MSVHPEMQPHHKFIYFVLMASLLIIEFRAMRKDRDDAQQAQTEAQKQLSTEETNRLQTLLDGERKNTAHLLDQENTNLSTFLKQDQKQFENTISTLLATHRQDEKDFADVVHKEEGLLKAQHDLSEQFTGRLVPGDSPTPPNACSHSNLGQEDGEVLIILGSNTDIGSGSHFVIFSVGGFPVISADRIADSSDLYLSVDFRDQNNRITFRMDKDGVVNKSNLILLRPDKSTFLLQDEYGEEIFRARFINPKTFEVSGKVTYCGKPFPVQASFASGLCLRFNKNGAMGYGAASCSTQQ